jgi:acyl-CoA hydrolase
MIRSEDLNHHGNLYAGRAIEWMMESSFIAAGLIYGNGEGLLYKNTHQFDFKKSILPGDIVTYVSTVVRVGRTSLTMHIGLYDEASGDMRAEGYTTFVTVDPRDRRPVAHGLALDPAADDEERRWRREAEEFFR